ncbi:MAG: hypothetical protein D6701_04900, partial [Gemmatimonadetes bacterium]
MSPIDPRTLVDARLELHHAVQLLAMFGQACVPARDDDSHRSMTWDGGRRAFRSEPSPAGIRVWLRPADLTVSVGSREHEAAALSLVGRTLDEAVAWLAEALADVGGAERPALTWPEYDLPDHPVRHGAAFSGGSEGHLRDLEARYHEAAALLDDLAGAEPHATPVRCWPHHFDIATLLLLDPEFGAADGRSVGVGMSPGDQGYPEPYWYVTPYPYPDLAGEPPPLPP